MNFDLTDTTASKINAALLESRRRSGSPATGAVLTLVIVTDEQGAYDSLKAAMEAAREHPARILVVVSRGGRGEPRLDAEVRTPGDNSAGEVVIMRLYGELAAHPASVVLPLLLPDAPVVTWWPGQPPDVPAEHPLGALSQRRVTDVASCDEPVAELRRLAGGYTPGDTDLAWTRLTTWRTVLAAALDAPYGPISGATVAAEPGNASAVLLGLWLGDRLGVPVQHQDSDGPGITAVVLHADEGDIAVERPDGRLAELSRPGWPQRRIALQRRPLAELLAEELRRLDPDDVYGRTLPLLLGQDAVAR